MTAKLELLKLIKTLARLQATFQPSFQEVPMLDHKIFQAYGLQSILDKVLSSQRLDIEEALKLWECENPLLLAQLAHLVRERCHSLHTSYVLNQQINYTNICINNCRFCSYRRDKNQPGAFELSLQDIRNKINAHQEQSITELHIVGGCHPEFSLSYFLEMLRLIRETKPQTSIKCLTPVEIEHLALLEKLPVADILSRLHAAGLEMLAGGGAEIFDPKLRSRICPEKISGARWLEISAVAHEMGIKTNCSMLFGHLESVRHRLEHLHLLRTQQDKTGGFLCFIPLPFQTANNQLQHTVQLTGLEELKTIAISRLMLDNIPHIKSSWVMLGLKQAQAALFWGADDLDGTVVEEKIGHMAGADSPQILSKMELEDMIRDCGLIPVERNLKFARIN